MTLFNPEISLFHPFSFTVIMYILWVCVCVKLDIWSAVKPDPWRLMRMLETSILKFLNALDLDHLQLLFPQFQLI